jgi:excisionase family DNA binding protein
VTHALNVPIPPELVEVIAARAADILEERQAHRGDPRWLYGAKAAAEYLGWPVKRVHNRVQAGELPHHPNGSRLCFRTDELDRYLRSAA